MYKDRVHSFLKHLKHSNHEKDNYIAISMSADQLNGAFPKITPDKVQTPGHNPKQNHYTFITQ
jgi:hypothetical protein